eukprot:GHVL01028220.1.p1 GENE.GHVL01028220.1~~GHVL01028220.1.p1  ORF type:complete len:162 (+),score=34.79 GHVL01028220.1:173-658(+)
MILSIYYGTYIYCYTYNNKLSICSNYIPNIYTYVQKEYWNVCLLCYWQYKNIPHFIVSLPTIVFIIFIIYYFIKQDNIYWKLIYKYIYIGEIIQLCILLYICIFIANIQIITRLVSSSPIYNIGLSILYIKNRYIKYIIVFYHSLYFTLGPLMYCSALPWV